MATIIPPTVGRVVWYYAAAGVTTPLAAIVAAVLSENVVNLGTFGSDGQPFPLSSVPLVQEGQTPPASGGYCAWMPYQIGQAHQHGHGRHGAAPPPAG